jgi:hypothetical protein
VIFIFVKDGVFGREIQAQRGLPRNPHEFVYYFKRITSAQIKVRQERIRNMTGHIYLNAGPLLNSLIAQTEVL